MPVKPVRKQSIKDKNYTPKKRNRLINACNKTIDIPLKEEEYLLALYISTDLGVLSS